MADDRAPAACSEPNEGEGPLVARLEPSAHAQSLAHDPHGAYAPTFCRAL